MCVTTTDDVQLPYSNIHTWKEMEEDIDEILVSPGNVVSVSLVVGDHQFDPATLTHSSQIH